MYTHHTATIIYSSSILGPEMPAIRSTNLGSILDDLYRFRIEELYRYLYYR